MNNPGVFPTRPFRRLWIALSLSGLGDWLSLLALTAFAWSLTDGYTSGAYAVGAVLVAKLLPVVVFGPLAGLLAEQLDRRWTMVVADVLRAGLMISVPLVGRLEWLFVAAFLVEFFTLFWRAASEAMVPGTVPPKESDRARKLVLLAVYGAAPVAGLLFAGVALIARAVLPGPDLTLYATAAVFLACLATVFSLRGERHPVSVPSLTGQILDGWKHVGGTPLVRGLIVGGIGASIACASVIGVSRIYVDALHGGDAGYGMVFAAVFVGLGFGLFLGPRMLPGFSRRRLFGLTLIFTSLVLVPTALVHDLVALFFLAALVGLGAGATVGGGHALIDGEIREEQRERASGYLQAMSRIALIVVLGLAPLAAGAAGAHLLRTGDLAYRADGTNGVLLVAALLTLITGLVSYRLMDDRRGIPLRRDLSGALTGVPYVPPVPKKDRGLFIAFEGGEGAGKTTQARLLAIWLRDNGFDVVTTREPGATKVGMRLRAILLDRETTALSSRAESLLYAADRAQHVDTVILPALESGAIVITDRYIDSSLAYQGFGRGISVAELLAVNEWATSEVRPDLTVLLDVPPSVGLNRFASPADRIESEPEDFHDRVRRGFRALADAEPHRYLVVDAAQAQSEITRQIQEKVLSILPDPVPASTEDITSTFPVITDA
ncbi:dTMP kinase [Actinocorallia libanotica]|uniref:Thymidylate kinase n=1 Tax=Actinocorallia libanotica TaxID=46162 RepID=A0ABN1RUD8_9ACTN